MGCSTFGQVAGLLTKGIKFFSTDCGGPSTPYQYKTIPTLNLTLTPTPTVSGFRGDREGRSHGCTPTQYTVTTYKVCQVCMYT